MLWRRFTSADAKLFFLVILSPWIRSTSIACPLVYSPLLWLQTLSNRLKGPLYAIRPLGFRTEATQSTWLPLFLIYSRLLCYLASTFKGPLGAFRPLGSRPIDMMVNFFTYILPWFGPLEAKPKALGHSKYNNDRDRSLFFEWKVTSFVMLLTCSWKFLAANVYCEVVKWRLSKCDRCTFLPPPFTTVNWLVSCYSEKVHAMFSLTPYLTLFRDEESPLILYPKKDETLASWGFIFFLLSTYTN